MPSVERDAAGRGRAPRRLQRRARAAGPCSSAWRTWFDNRRAAIDRRISNHLKLLKSRLQPHSRLLESVEYSLGDGGKRVRPVLVLEACRVCGGDEEAAWPAALAIECVHAFSLIHDDLPAMDNDDLRRGKPTNHKVFGEALAMLAGDWLLSHAFELLSSDEVDQRVAPALARTLAEGTRDMIVGQGADIAGQQQPSDPALVRFIHRNKTARLIETACRLGALAADAPAARVEALGTYGHHLGLAFQIRDDLLDAAGSTDRAGKRVAKDVAAAKQTYPAAFGLEQSQRLAAAEVAAAVAALVPFGSRADRLRALARYVLRRDR